MPATRSDTLRAAAHAVRVWRAEPVQFVRQNFGVEPDEWQADALRAFADPDPSKARISLQACVGPGKSAVLAWCGWHFLACQGSAGDHPKGYAVAVTGDNLRANLWPELAKWRARSLYLNAAFEWQAERCFARDHRATWFLEARSWPKTASPDEAGRTLSGLHGGYVLVLADESGSIPVAVAKAAEQALSTSAHFAKVLQAGNPLSRDGMLYYAAASSFWHKIRITGDPDDSRRSPRISVEWARQQIAEFGRDNPWVMAHILGQFPATAVNTLLSLADVEAAQQRRAEIDPRLPCILGVDVGTVQDACVIYVRNGRTLIKARVLRGASTVAIAATVVDIAREYSAQTIFVDAGGPGIGVVDQLRALGQRALVPVYFGGAADNPARYANKRIEMYHRAAEWVKEGGALPPQDPELTQDLVELQVAYNLKGQMIAEPKEDLKVRLGRSTDWGDGFALTFAFPVPVQPTHDVFAAQDRAKARKRFGSNPFDWRS